MGYLIGEFDNASQLVWALVRITYMRMKQYLKYEAVYQSNAKTINLIKFQM